MEGRRRRRWNSNNRRSQCRSSHHGGSGSSNSNWQPVVPKWEKDFCKVVGSIDWETLLQMKRFTHLYEDVIGWDDSAGEEAFSDAKRRYWAETNGFFCRLPLPDPNMYIDEIDWDSKAGADVDTKPVMISDVGERHDPVVIFGDSLFPNQAYSLAGWGDEEYNFKAPDNEILISPTTNHGCDEKLDENGGNSLDDGDNNNNSSTLRLGDDESGPTGYAVLLGDGWTDDWKWNYINKDAMYQVGPGIKHLDWMQESGIHWIRARP